MMVQKPGTVRVKRLWGLKNQEKHWRRILQCCWICSYGEDRRESVLKRGHKILGDLTGQTVWKENENKVRQTRHPRGPLGL